MFTEFGRRRAAGAPAVWDWEFCCFHGPEWWRTHWEKTGKVDVDVSDAIEDAWQDWLRFDEVTLPTLDGWRGRGHELVGDVAPADRGRYLGFTRMVATKR